MPHISERIKNWLKNPYNLTFVCLILAAVLIRIFYLALTKNQPLWWDEAEYMSIAKNWAFGIPYDVPAHRPVVVPFIAMILLKIGLAEFAVKLLVSFIPSIALICTSYLLVSRYIGKLTALVTSVMLAVSWTLMFHAFRVHVDTFLAFLTMLTVYVFLRGYEKQSNKYMALAGLLLGLTFITKFTAALFVVSVFALIFLTLRFSAFKRKDMWIFAVSAFAVLLLYLAYAQMAYGSAFQPFFQGSHVVQAVTEGDAAKFFHPIPWGDFKQIYEMLIWPFFIFFAIGIFAFLKYLFYIDKILKNPGEFKGDLFRILLTIFLALEMIFLFFINRYVEDRLLVPLLPVLFLISAEGMVWVYSKIKPSGKALGAVFLAVVLLFGGYLQLSQADKSINLSKDSYGQVKEAGLWLKANTPQDAVILSRSYPQISFYSERKTLTFSALNNVSEFEDMIKNEKASYLMISIYENHQQWILEWVDKNKEKLEAVNYYMIDNKPSLIIYKLK